MNLTLCISTLGTGGAERVAVLLCNRWAALGHRVTLVTLDHGETLAYPLCPQVRRVALHGGFPPGKQGLRKLLHRPLGLWHLRRLLVRTSPDVVISFMDLTNLIVLLVTLGSSLPVVVAERNDPARRILPRPLAAARRLLYPRAAAVVVQTRRVRGWFERFLQSRLLTVIENPLPHRDDRGSSDAGEPGLDLQHPAVVAMGRLTPQKGFDLLLEAFAEVRAEPRPHLYLLGSGPLREALEHQAERLGLVGRVHFLGTVRNPGAILRKADLFVLSSRYEGFPNALCEAMACGLPVVSADCPCGPAELIEPEKNGLLVPPGSSAALCLAMERLLGDPGLARRLGREAERIVERLSLERIAEEWLTLFTAIAAAGRTAQQA
ncbi:MAG: hypothetical protein A2284_16250 [Deltaproteobacteria bacterium RIFOXYA12_FULL_61_11]|nr:MAG: hypothetical protein A2284_16250 [Deltaproteobacteria bacterium RIFOXYA12_FULL_61_11]